MIRLTINLSMALLFCGCAGSGKAIENFDFSKVEKVAVLPFQPEYPLPQGLTSEIGNWTSDEFARMLDRLQAFSVIGEDIMQTAFSEMEITADPLLTGNDLIRFGEEADVDYVFRGRIELFKPMEGPREFELAKIGAGLQVELLFAPNDSVVWRVKEDSPEDQPLINYQSAIRSCVSRIKTRIENNLFVRTDTGN